MPKFEVYVTEVISTHYKPVIVEAATIADAKRMAEEMVAHDEVDELDGNTEYLHDVFPV